MASLADRMISIVHLTSVHSPDDPRIFSKECRTLADAGFDVTLIVPAQCSEVRQGVRIRAISPPASRLRRITRTTWNVYKAGAASGAEVCHIHDPELIPAGLLLKLHGKRVVYDVHEDYVTSVRQKDYVPSFLRRPLSVLLGTLEWLIAKWCAIVVAERYYLKRFPRGTVVLNYPRTDMLPSSKPRGDRTPPQIRLLYTGVVSEDRGALTHARLVNTSEDIHVHVVGRCETDLAAAMRGVAGSGVSRLHMTGEGAHVPYQTILDAYECGGWTAGLALFPDTPHYRDKELTKFFEYMAAGIPIICSNLPTWVSLVEGIGCGLCVDANDQAAILGAVRYLVDHPEEAAGMARRGRCAVDTRFNWTHEAEALVAFYHDLVRPTPSG